MHIDTSRKNTLQTHRQITEALHRVQEIIWRWERLLVGLDQKSWGNANDMGLMEKMRKIRQTSD